MARVHFYITRDSDGTYAGEGVEEGVSVTLVSIQARQPIGFTVLDADRVARPELRPIDSLVVKRARLLDLRAKGWAGLTAEERDEAQALRFDLGV